MTQTNDTVLFTLRNGADVLKSRQESGRHIVLCQWNGEYVTWWIDAERNAFWGHYFRDLAKAEADFRAR